MLQEFFKKLKIRVKLLMAFGSIILLSVLLTFFAITSINNIIGYKNINEELDKLSTNLERIELATQEFISEGYKANSFQETDSSEIVTRFNKSIVGANENLQTITDSHLLADREMGEIAKSVLESKVIQATFEEVKNLLKERGFKDFGLEGSLRNAIHAVEKSSLDYDKVAMLTLRRHEKDFFLRKDLKYQKEFAATVEEFRQNLMANNNTDLVVLLDNYQSKFNQVVEIERKIGLTNTEGIKGKLYTELNSIREKTSVFQNRIRGINESQINQSKILLIIIFSIQFIGAVALAILYSNVITSVIKEIREAMRKLADGSFPKPLNVHTTEEIGQTKLAINQFLERLQAATSFAEKLGGGELKAIYDTRYNNDVLAKAIISMQQKLKESEKVQAKINWNNEGAMRFNEILKNESEDITALGDKILKVLVGYLGANQAVLYAVNKDQQCFERISTYAYGKKKIMEQTIDLTTGLIGQCAMEKTTIYLKEIPTDYVKITSGLGEATPKNVVIVPLKMKEEVNGVLELASFEIIEEHKIEFLEKMAENVASILHNRQVAQQTKKLLEESRSRESELVQQEEEMRQNAEELQATQEEMQRQSSAMDREIVLLKQKINQYESRLSVLN
jgi:GAF domain-containing protein